MFFQSFGFPARIQPSQFKFPVPASRPPDPAVHPIMDIRAFSVSTSHQANLLAYISSPLQCFDRFIAARILYQKEPHGTRFRNSKNGFGKESRRASAPGACGCNWGWLQAHSGSKNRHPVDCLLSYRESRPERAVTTRPGAVRHRRHPHRCGDHRRYPRAPVPDCSAPAGTWRGQHWASRHHGRYPRVSRQKRRAALHAVKQPRAR